MDNLLNNNLKINKISDSIIIVDDILDNSVVNFLRLRMQTAKEFEDHYRDYAAINYTYNNDKFTADLSNELINRFKLNDFVPETETQNRSALPETPPINSAIIQPVQQASVSQTGLTPSEQALLSPEEQAIRLRQRGMA